MPWTKLDVRVSDQTIDVRWGKTTLVATAPVEFDLKNGFWGVGSLEGGLGRIRSITLR